MKNLREYLEEQINENLIQAVLSAGRNKDGISKIKIRPIRLKGQICYQASATEGQKVLQTVPKYSSRAALFHLLLADYNSWIILTVNLTLCSIAAISNSA